MNWEIISNQHSSLQEYRLVDENECKLSLKYNPRHQSVRVTSGPNHRLFFLESTGSLNDKSILKNEYGLEIGNLISDKPLNKNGSVMMDSRKYYYHISDDNLLFYKSNPHQPLITCNIKFADPLKFANKLSSLDIRCTVLGLCWYVILQVTNGSMPEIMILT
jgi:hypothetical protein